MPLGHVDRVRMERDAGKYSLCLECYAQVGLASWRRISTSVPVLPLLWAEHRSPQALLEGSASRAASPAPPGARSLPKSRVLCGGPGMGQLRTPAGPSSGPAARLKSVTGRFMPSHCASALSQFLPGTERGRQPAAVFFFLLTSDARSLKPYIQHLASPPPARQHFIIWKQGTPLAMCVEVILVPSKVPVSLLHLLPFSPQRSSRAAGRSLAAFQRFGFRISSLTLRLFCGFVLC